MKEMVCRIQNIFADFDKPDEILYASPIVIFIFHHLIDMYFIIV